MAVGYVIPDGFAQSLDTLATALEAEANIINADVDPTGPVGAPSTGISRVVVLGVSSTDITNAISAVGSCKLQPGTTITDTPLGSAEMLLLGQKWSGSGDWADLSGNGHDATPTGTPVADGVGITVTEDNYFTVPDHADLDFDFTTDSATLLVSFDRLVLLDDATVRYLAYKVSGSPTTNPGYGLYISNSERLGGLVDDGTSSHFIPGGYNLFEVYGLDAIDLVTYGFARTTDTAHPFLRSNLENDYGASTISIGSVANAVDMLIGKMDASGSNKESLRLRAVALWRSELTETEMETAAEWMLKI